MGVHKSRAPLLTSDTRCADLAARAMIHTMPDPIAPPRRWVSREQAAEYLSVSAHAVDRLARSGQLTRYKVGRLPRYDITEIDSLVLASARTTVSGGE